MKLLQSQKRSTLPKSPNDLDTEYFVEAFELAVNIFIVS